MPTSSALRQRPLGRALLLLAAVAAPMMAQAPAARPAPAATARVLVADVSEQAPGTPVAIEILAVGTHRYRVLVDTRRATPEDVDAALNAVGRLISRYADSTSDLRIVPRSPGGSLSATQRAGMQQELARLRGARRQAVDGLGVVPARTVTVRVPPR